MLKAQPAELIGRTLWHHCPRAEYPDEQARLYQSIATRGTSAVYEEKPGETLTGSHFHVIAQPVRDQGGRVVAIKKLRRDISERVADEQLDRQRNRMEAIGTLSAGIAHDFNNILGGVILNSELALLDPDLSSDSRGLLEGILAAGQRARDLVGQIQTFSRQDGSSKAALDLIDLLEASLRFLRATIPSSIALDFNCASSEALVEGNAAQLNQLVINLVTNAVHAIAPRPGRISINLRPRRLGPKSPRSGELQSDSYWELSVTDDGCGMPPEVAARVCEPFFTTHAETSGMGLAVVHGIVADLGGSLSFASQPGLGTCVTVLLPRPAGGDQAAAEPEADRPTSILLVEDDPVIRTATAKMLEKLGCVVTSCPEAQQALNLMDERPHAWDLLITDLTLPGIQGLDLTRRIKALRPDMAVIISTGYHAPITEGDLREAGISLVLEKPFTRRELADGLERALGRPVNG